MQTTNTDSAIDRQLIVKAAIAPFLKHGLPVTTMADIIEESGLSSDVVLGHFLAKNDILRVLGNANTVTATGALREMLKESPLPPVDEFVGRLAVFFEKSVESGDPVSVTPQGWGVALYDPEVNAIMTEVVASLRDAWIEVAERMVEEGRLPVEADPQDVGRTFFSLFLGFMLQSLLGDVKADHLRRALHAVLR
jgi:AcrR family transcriptional regulator